MKYYYGAKREPLNAWVGFVYHWDPTGNSQISDFEERGFESENHALDAAAQYCEDNDIDAELA